MLDGKEMIKVHIASTPTQQKNLTSFETVLNPNQQRQCLTLISKGSA